jgi:prepilin-type N-terminal cleavage/methylation domain-containing protein
MVRPEAARIHRPREAGVTLLETLVALSILAIIAIAFFNGIATSSKVAYIGDEQATAESLARSQMEWVKKASYSYSVDGYSTGPIPVTRDYINYSAIIDVEPLHDPDDGIQKITVTIIHSNKEVFKLEDYKVDR